MKAWKVILAVVIILGLVFLFMSFRKKPDLTPIKKATIIEVDPDMILHLGDEGEIVRLLQIAVNNKLQQFNLFGSINEDGVFGDSTERAIKRLTQNLLSSASNNITVNNIRYRTNW